MSGGGSGLGGLFPLLRAAAAAEIAKAFAPMSDGQTAPSAPVRAVTERGQVAGSQAVSPLVSDTPASRPPAQHPGLAGLTPPPQMRASVGLVAARLEAAVPALPMTGGGAEAEPSVPLQLAGRAVAAAVAEGARSPVPPAVHGSSPATPTAVAGSQGQAAMPPAPAPPSPKAATGTGAIVAPMGNAALVPVTGGGGEPPRSDAPATDATLRTAAPTGAAIPSRGPVAGSAVPAAPGLGGVAAAALPEVQATVAQGPDRRLSRDAGASFPTPSPAVAPEGVPRSAVPDRPAPALVLPGSEVQPDLPPATLRHAAVGITSSGVGPSVGSGASSGASPADPTTGATTSRLALPAAVAEAAGTGAFPFTIAGQTASAASLLIFNAAMIPSWPPPLRLDQASQDQVEIQRAGATLAQMTPEEASEYLAKMAAAFGFLLVVKKHLSRSLKEEKEGILGLFAFLGVAMDALARGLQLALDLTAEQQGMLAEVLVEQGRKPRDGRQRLTL